MFKVMGLMASLAAVVGLSLVIHDDSHSKTRDPERPQAMAVLEIHASGRVEGVTEEIDLRTQLVGRVAEVLVREGQVVEAGKPLLRLDGVQEETVRAAAAAELAAREAELDRLLNGAHVEERREAAAEVDALTARLEGTRQRHVRITTLRQTGASSAQELDDLTAEVKMLTAQVAAARARQALLDAPPRSEDLRLAQSHVAAARARVEMAHDECNRTTLRAPLAAQVLRIDSQLGELTGPESLQPAVILADTSRLYVRAYVEEFDVPSVRVGSPARAIADGLPKRAAHGHVVRLAPRMSQKPLRTDDPTERFDTKVREVWIELDGRDIEGLVPGLPVDVVIGSQCKSAEPQSSPTLADIDGIKPAGGD